MTLFDEDADYRAFLRVVGEALRLAPMRICGYCLMPNHGHYLLGPDHVNQPQTEGEVEAIQRAIRRGAPLGSPIWV
jgi:REP element-mobilizing transposase RayT